MTHCKSELYKALTKHESRCHGTQNLDFSWFEMECAFGLKGKDYVIVACDGHVDFSIINFKKDEDKIRVVCLLILQLSVQSLD